MKYAIIAARVLLGLGFVVFGANVVHPFLPMPPAPPNPLVGKFMEVMIPTHWMTVVGLVQLVGGLLVLAGCTAPLGLTFLAPVLVNILCFHLCLEGGTGIAPGLVFTALELFLLYAYRDHFKPLLSCAATPSR
jgi:putative oxidoreductase